MDQDTNLLGFVSGKLLEPRVETSLHSLGVALEGRLAPADVALRVGDLDEEPARGQPEVLHLLDWGHGCGVTLRPVVSVEVGDVAVWGMGRM